jgi:glycosyltransferase involved in cell wall biosynthesis
MTNEPNTGIANSLPVVMVDFSGRGGISQYIFCLSHALAQQGADVRLLTTRDLELVMQTGAVKYEKILYPHRRQRSFFAKGVVYAGSLWRLLARLHTLKPALLHVHETKMPGVEKILWRYLKTKNIRLVLTAHDLFHPEKRATRGTLQEAYASFDRIIVHAEENRQTLLGAFELDSRKIRVVPHGEYSALASRPPDPAEARRRLDLPLDSKNILFFGYIRPYKGLHILLEAFAAARREDGSLRLIIAGELKEDFAAYDNFIAKNKLAAYIHKNLDYIPMESVPIYFAAADLVALPYLSVYQSGIVPLAYAHRRPVIATAVGGLPEIVEHEKTGWLVVPGSPAQFAEAIRTAFSSMTQLRKMGDAAYETARQKYSWEGIAARTLEIYDETLNETNPLLAIPMKNLVDK